MDIWGLNDGIRYINKLIITFPKKYQGIPGLDASCFSYLFSNPLPLANTICENWNKHTNKEILFSLSGTLFILISIKPLHMILNTQKRTTAENMLTLTLMLTWNLLHNVVKTDSQQNLCHHHSINIILLVMFLVMFEWRADL